MVNLNTPAKDKIGPFDRAVLEAHVYRRLRRQHNADDVIMEVCNEAGLTWDEAEKFVSEVQIVRKPTRHLQYIFIGLGSVMIFIGLMATLFILGVVFLGLPPDIVTKNAVLNRLLPGIGQDIEMIIYATWGTQLPSDLLAFAVMFMLGGAAGIAIANRELEK